MAIWVDADACPQVIKEILYRAAERAQVVTTLVANTSLRVPPSPFIRTLRVDHGWDVADQRIVEQVGPGDLVVTADIPLAALVIARGAQALDPRGELYTEDNVQERLAVEASRLPTTARAPVMHGCSSIPRARAVERASRSGGPSRRYWLKTATTRS